MKFLIAAAILCLLSPAFVRGQSADEQYVRIYQTIQEADRLNDSGQSRAAAVKYVEAQQSLTRFRGIYPGWNERVINYRLNYVTTKLAPLAAALTAPGTIPPTNAPSASAAITTTNGPGTISTNVVAGSIPPSPPMSSEWENQVKALQAELERLQTDNRMLSAKLKEALSVQPAAVDPRELAKAEERIRALQKENELYKIQMSQRPASAPSPATQELTAKLNEQSEVVAALRAENEILKKQSTDWQQKYTALASVPAPRSEPAPAPAVERESALGELAANNRALQKQVELWKHLAQTAQRSQPTPLEMPTEAQRELRALRARVEALEAKPVPYTAEERALFQRSPPSLAANVATSIAATGTASVVPPAEGPLTGVSRGIPPGAGALVLAAERAFRRANFAEAEQKYLEVLRQDENNVTMLGNLAAAQLEQSRIPEAEKNVMRALQVDPNDHFTLYLLGRIRFDQGKLEEALDALSRSVQARSDYAAAQNYLGIVLSEKGLRGPAEAALRRAVQLQPDYAAAHNNLAVVYATQQPPALALARWHYRKALAAGHQKNPDLEKLFGPAQ